MNGANRLVWFQWICMGLIGLWALSLTWGTSSLERMMVFADGVNTCFSRLQQSYTAKVSGRASKHLDNTFLKDTESCFSEANNYLETNFKTPLINALAGLNTLGTDVHWFHQLLKRPAQGKFFDSESFFVQSLAGRFEKLEAAKNSLLDILDQQRRGRMGTVGRVRMVFGGVVLGILLFIFSLFLRRWPRHIRQRHGNSSNENFGKSDGGELKAASPVVASLRTPCPENPSSRPLARDCKKVSLSNALASVVDVLAGKIFAMGVRVELSIEEELKVYAHKESLEQTFYHLVSYFLKSFKEGAMGRLSLVGSLSKGTVAIDIFCSQCSFSDDFLQGHLKPDNPAGWENCAELQIPAILVREFGGSLTFSNVMGPDGERAGAKAVVTLKAVAKAKGGALGRTVRIERGKKRELLQRLSSI